MAPTDRSGARLSASRIERSRISAGRPDARIDPIRAGGKANIRPAIDRARAGHHEAAEGWPAASRPAQPHWDR